MRLKPDLTRCGEPLVPVMASVGGAAGFFLDRRRPWRGLLAGAVAGASLAAMISLIRGGSDRNLAFYSSGTLLYGEQETEAGV